MPFQMKIQTIDAKSAIKNDTVKPAAKSRLKRLFERQFPKLAGAGDGKEKEKDDGGELEPSSVCLDKLVVSFMEDGNEKSAKCGRSRCNCFNGNCDDSSDEEFAGDSPPIGAAGSGDALEVLKVVTISLFEQDPGGFVDILMKFLFLLFITQIG